MQYTHIYHIIIIITTTTTIIIIIIIMKKHVPLNPIDSSELP